MKLSKKKIFLLVFVLTLMILLTFALCSFDFPSYGSILSFPNGLSITDQSTLVTIFNLQELCGSFNSVVPVFCYKSDNYIILFATYKGYSYTFNPQPEGANFSINSNNVFLRFYFSEGGFSYSGTASYSAAAPKSDVLFYRTSLTSDIVSNTLFSGPSNPLDSRIDSVLSYWYNFYRQLLLDLQIEVESAYNAGYETGVETGYIIGWDEGYETGYNSGYNYGLADGYQTGYGAGAVDGFVDGYDVGYDTGYADGYDTGYDSGYSEAERETVIRYVEPVELDVPRIINGIGAVPRQVLDGVDFEIFGVPILGVLLSILILTISIFVIRKMK